MKPIQVLATLVMLAFSGSVLAQGKIVVVDIVAAIQQTDIAQKRVEELKNNSEFAELQAQLESVTKELQDMQENAEKDSVTWSQEQQTEFAKKREYKMADRKLLVEKLQKEDRALSEQIMRDLGPRAQQALNAIVEEEDIDVVLRAENNVLYVSESHNITAKLTDRINKMQ